MCGPPLASDTHTRAQGAARRARRPFHSFLPALLISDLWMWGMTPPPAMVALIRVSSSSSPRMASCRWRGVMRLTCDVMKGERGAERVGSGQARPLVVGGRLGRGVAESRGRALCLPLPICLPLVSSPTLVPSGPWTRYRRAQEPRRSDTLLCECALACTCAGGRAGWGGVGERGRGREHWRVRTCVYARAHARAHHNAWRARGVLCCAPTHVVPPIPTPLDCMQDRQTYPGWRRCRRRRWHRRGRWR